MKPLSLQFRSYAAFIALALIGFLVVGVLLEAANQTLSGYADGSSNSIMLTRQSRVRWRNFSITIETVPAITGSVPIPDSTSTLVAQASPSVVSIDGYKDVPVYTRRYIRRSDGTTAMTRTQVGTQKQKVSSGSGFFITANGYLLTNKHVVADTSAAYTVNYTGTSEVAAQIVYRDPDNDLAIVKIDGDNYPTIQLGDSSVLTVGERVVGIGNALGRFTDSVSSGAIVALGQDIVVGGNDGTSEKLTDVIETSAKLYPGDSGGPLLDPSGNAIGINTATTLGGRTIAGYSIPINVAKSVIAKAGIRV